MVVNVYIHIYLYKYMLVVWIRVCAFKYQQPTITIHWNRPRAQPSWALREKLYILSAGAPNSHIIFIMAACFALCFVVGTKSCLRCENHSSHTHRHSTTHIPAHTHTTYWHTSRTSNVCYTYNIHSPNAYYALTLSILSALSSELARTRLLQPDLERKKSVRTDVD